MSIEVMTYVWKYSRMTGTGLLMMLCIADRSDHRGTGTHYSVETIAIKTRCSRRQVTRLLRQAETMGELVVDRNQGGRGEHVYQVLME